MKMHMRTKILLLCLCSTLLALILQTFFFQRASASLIYRLAKTERFETLQNMQNEVNTYLRSVENDLIEVYHQNDFLQDLKEKTSVKVLKERYYRLAYTLATEKFDTSSRVVALYVYNADNEIISTYRRAVTPKHHYPKDIYEDTKACNGERVKNYIESKDTRLFISSYYNTYRETNIARFVLKIYDNSSTRDVAGYVVCDADSSVLEKIMEKYQNQEEVYMWLQPQGDRKITGTGRLEQANEAYYQEIVQQIEEQTMKAEQDRGGYNRVLFQVPQKNYNLDAYSIMPQSILHQNQKTLTQNVILIAVLMLVMITFATFYITKGLTRPLEKLTETIEQIRSGKTNERVSYLASDEIGRLGQEFNEMLDEIQQLISQEYESQLLLNKAEYKALQAQINPHFLYNTLDTMSSIASIQNCPVVSNLCQSLSNLFRYSLDYKNPYSTVAKEIVHLKNYIFVMNVRMREEIQYQFAIDEEVLRDSIPRISIQPLVENAVNHGLRNKKGEKRILISALAEENVMCISVEDNGVGMDAEEMNAKLRENNKDMVESGDSIGLFNIHARMKMLYGDTYGLHIESGLQGTKVSLRIPRVKVNEVGTWQKQDINC